MAIEGCQSTDPSAVLQPSETKDRGRLDNFKLSSSNKEEKEGSCDPVITDTGSAARLLTRVSHVFINEKSSPSFLPQC